MTIRSYSNLIVLETVLDSIPTSNADVNQLAHTVFNPRVEVTSSDCGTTLGRIVEVNYELAGKVELATGNVISLDRIKELLSQGIYEVATRSLDTCISEDGICQSCYHASRQYLPIPEVGDTVEVLPEYIKAVDYFTTEPGSQTFEISQSPDLYDFAYVYYQGFLVSPVAYSITGTTLTFSQPVTHYDQVTVRFAVNTKSPFLSWLADTYSGSLLGLKALPYPPLPIRRKLLASIVPSSVVELLAEKTSELKGVPNDVISSYPLIKDPLEKALLILTIYGVYLNIQS